MLPVLVFIGTQASMEEPTYEQAADGPDEVHPRRSAAPANVVAWPENRARKCEMKLDGIPGSKSNPDANH
jgi:hypothetical protein